jgi:YggT family protein
MLIINTLFDLYILLVLLRFLFQMLRADFYNPVSQFIVKLTTPPLKILRRVIPSVGGQDAASIVLCLLLIYAKFLLMRALSIPAVHIGGVMAPLSVSYGGLLVFSVADLVALILTVFLVAIIIKVIHWRTRPVAAVSYPAGAGGKDVDRTANHLPRKLLTTSPATGKLQVPSS